MWNLKNRTNKQNKAKLRLRYKEQIGGCQKGEGLVRSKMDVGDQEAQTSSCKISKSWGCNAQHGEYSQ